MLQENILKILLKINYDDLQAANAHS